MQSGRKLLKVVMLGDSQVGKTAIMTRYVQNKIQAPSQYKATIGVDFLVKGLVVGEQQVDMKILDVAGQEQFQSYGYAALRGANIFLLVCSPDVPNSVERMKTEFERVKSHTSAISESAIYAVVINKKDLNATAGSKAVKVKEEAQDFAAKNEMEVYEVSALTSNTMNVEADEKIVYENDPINRMFAALTIKALELQKTEELNVKQEQDQITNQTEINKIIDNYKALYNFLEKENARNDFIKNRAGKNKELMFSVAYVRFVEYFNLPTKTNNDIDWQKVSDDLKALDPIELEERRKKIVSKIEANKALAGVHTETRKNSLFAWLFKFNMFRKPKSLQDFNEFFDENNNPKPPRKK